jgi:hypothetical protein
MPPATEIEVRALAERLNRLEAALFKPTPEIYTQFFDRVFKFHGPLQSSAALSSREKVDADLFFQNRERSEIALTAASSWHGGDYFEFGSHDLNTFRNMLTAYDVTRQSDRYPDVRFYGFDLFGRRTTSNEAAHRNLDTLRDYFAPYLAAGDQYDQHLQFVDEHQLFADRCFLVQGFFQDTLTAAFKTAYRREERSIGFAFIDCNVESSYKVVFEFIFDLLAPNGYLYMDEYFVWPYVFTQFQQFRTELAAKRHIACEYIRNAGGFGGLFRLYDMRGQPQPLSLTAGDS